MKQETEKYKTLVLRKMKAYHLHVQFGCIAQGVMLHLAIRYREQVWGQFRSWLRTMDPTRPPSELVVAYVLRDQLHGFFAGLRKCLKMEKILDDYLIQQEDALSQKVA